MKFHRVLKYGIGFCAIGILFLLIANDSTAAMFIGALGFSIGTLTCIYYNCKKIEFQKLLKCRFALEGYKLPIRKVLVVSWLIIGVLVIATSAYWSYLSYKSLISSNAFKWIGMIYFVLIIPALYLALSKPSRFVALNNETINAATEVLLKNL